MQRVRIGWASIPADPCTSPTPGARPAMASEQVLIQAANSFFTAYQNLLKDTNDITDTLDALLNTFTADPSSPYSASLEPTIEYAGQSGAVPYFGQFRGEKGLRNAFTGLTQTIDTNSLTVQEILSSSFAIDFTQANPLIPQNNRVAVLFEEEQTAEETGLRYRLDSIALLTVEENGKISKANIYYDSYVPMQAYLGHASLITNPDIDDLLDSRRNRATTSEQTINAAFGFFGTFAGIDGAAKLIAPDDNKTPDFKPLLPTVTEDVVLKFAGDPLYLPFADSEIRTGRAAVEQTFLEQFTHSRPRTFDMKEWFVGNDRLLANTFEQRTAVATHKGYDVQVEILLTAKDGKVGSVEGMFDSVITTTAFTGKDPFPTSFVPNAEKPVVRQQGEAELLNLTAHTKGEKVKVQLDIFSEAAYNNTIGIFQVDDITGQINGIKPGDAGYLRAAFDKTVLSFNRGQAVTSGSSTVTRNVLSENVGGGTILASYIITNGTVDSFLKANPTNIRQSGSPNAYCTYIAANPDSFDHFRMAGNSFLVEDLWAGGDRDYNDMHYAVTVTPIG